MEKHITLGQLNGLSRNEAILLFAWCYLKEGKYLEKDNGSIRPALLTISQLMEFLDEHRKDYIKDIVAFKNNSEKLFMLWSEVRHTLGQLAQEARKH